MYVKISEVLPKSFGLIFDGWTADGTHDHYVAIIASFMRNAYQEKILLAFSPMNDEADLTANAHIQFIEDTLHHYGKNLDCIEFLSGDNCNTNIAISDRMENVPLVGCAAHRLNLAMQWWFDQEPHKSHIEKVESLSGKLSTTKMSTRLRNSTIGKVAKKRQSTRWQGTTNMINRYIELQPTLSAMRRGRELSAEIVSLLPTATEHEELVDLSLQFGDFDTAYQQLQKRDKQDLHRVRGIFDYLIAKRPELGRFLGPDANIVHNKHFENAVIKVIGHEEDLLSAPEKRAISKYRIIPEEPSADGASAANNAQISPPGSGLMRAMQAAESAKKQKVMIPSAYRCLEHITGTSTLVESLNSYAKLIFSDRRKSMYPKNLELLLMLKFNRSMWNIEMVNTIVLSAGGGSSSSSSISMPIEGTFDEDDENED
jgi:hypothetical protein